MMARAAGSASEQSGPASWGGPVTDGKPTTREKNSAPGNAVEARPKKLALPKPSKPALQAAQSSKRRDLAVPMILRRQKLTRGALLERQISRGRPDTRMNFCFRLNCLAEAVAFDVPRYYLMDKELNDDDLPVIDCHKDFVKAMVEHLFPDLVDFAAKTAKLQDIWSFVDSPPIRASFWRFLSVCSVNRIQINQEELQTVLMEVQPIFQDAVFGVKTRERVAIVHEYLDVDDGKPRDLKFAALQFLFRAELFRKHRTCRSAAWKMETPEQAAQFLTALTLNYWIMTWDRCFLQVNMMCDQHWEYTWDAWFDKFPVSSSTRLAHAPNNGNDGDLVVREEHEASEEDFLQNVGYLGGLGKYEAHRPNPIRRMRR